MNLDPEAVLEISKIFDAEFFLQLVLDALDVPLRLAENHQVAHVNPDDDVLLSCHSNKHTVSPR